MSMIEGLKKGARLTGEKRIAIYQEYLKEHPDHLEPECEFSFLNKMLKAQQDEDFKVFAEWCDKNNIYQVVEGELPKNKMSMASKLLFATADEARKDIIKWHKQSLKPVSEILGL